MRLVPETMSCMSERDFAACLLHFHVIEAIMKVGEVTEKIGSGSRYSFQEAQYEFLLSRTVSASAKFYRDEVFIKNTETQKIEFHTCYFSRGAVFKVGHFHFSNSFYTDIQDICAKLIKQNIS